MPPDEPTIGATPVAPTPEPVVTQEPTPEPVAAPLEPVVAAALPAEEAAAEVVAEPAAAEQATPEGKPETAPHTDTATLLEGAGKDAAAQEARPTETAPATPTEGTAPVYEFTLPEGVTLDPERVTAYTEVLGQHQVPPEAGQALLDMHTAEMQRYADHLRSEQHRIFSETRAAWREQVKADEQLGGAGHETAMKAIARMRDLLVPEADRAAFEDALRVTGAGDHPAILRAFHNAARLFDEPAPPSVQARPSASGAPPQGRGYRGVMYDHPSSRRAMGG